MRPRIMSDNKRSQGSRILGGLLMALGTVALIVSVFMNSRFGWGLSQDLLDRGTLAILHGMVDPSSAALICCGAMTWRWGAAWWTASVAAWACAVVFICYSMLSVYGFMSERIAVVGAQNARIEQQLGSIKWLQGQSVNKENSKVDRRLAWQELRTANRNLQASLGIIPDKQAAAIASLLGWSVPEVQRLLVMVASG